MTLQRIRKILPLQRSREEKDKGANCWENIAPIYLEAETALTMQKDLDTASKVIKYNNNNNNKIKGAETRKQSGF